MDEKNKPLLCWVTDRKQLPPGHSFEDAVTAALAAGVDWIQIREKDLPARELLRRVRETLVRCADCNVRVLVNDRLDVALAGGAHGVHLGRESLPLREATRWIRSAGLGGKFLFGVSCHSVEELQAAARDGADYAIFGPVFDTPSKRRFGPPLGLEALREACLSTRIPVLAIGGITREKVAECMGAGAAGVAAIRMFQS